MNIAAADKTFSPPIEPLGIADRAVVQVEKFAARHAKVAAVAGLAFWVLGFVAFTAPAPTFWVGVAIGVGAAVATMIGQNVVLAVAKMAKHSFWENWFLPRDGKMPAPGLFGHRCFTERTVAVADKTVASLSYEEGNDLALVKLVGSSYYDNGYLHATLLAPAIHHLYHSVYKPLLAADPSLREEAKSWPLPWMYEMELHGMAEGLADYEERTGYPVKEIDHIALKAANLAIEKLRRADTAVVEGTVEHLDHTPSKNLLARYAFHNCTTYRCADGERDRHVEYISYPGLIGTSIATNSDGLVAGVSPDLEMTNTSKAMPASIVPRFCTESCGTASEADRALPRPSTLAPEAFPIAAQSVVLVDPKEAYQVFPNKEIVCEPPHCPPQGERNTTLAARIIPGGEAVWERDYYGAHRKLATC